MSQSGDSRARPTSVATFTYDASSRLISVEALTPQGSSCEHDSTKRVFRVTDPDGKVTEFHDRAVRFLVVARTRRRANWSRCARGGCPRSFICAGRQGFEQWRVASGEWRVASGGWRVRTGVQAWRWAADGMGLAWFACIFRVFGVFRGSHQPLLVELSNDLHHHPLLQPARVHAALPRGDLPPHAAAVRADRRR